MSINIIPKRYIKSIGTLNSLQPVHRGVMARTKDKYILMDVTSTTDKAVTGILIVLTMCGILLLFWYQNFGPGIKIGSQTTLKI